MIDYTILPPEAWLTVVEFLILAVPIFDPKASENDSAVLKISPHIQAVSSLSRFFYQLTYPYRFREVHFMVDGAKSPTLKLRRIGELLDFLERRPEAKTWIRVLSTGRESPSIGRPWGNNLERNYIALERRIHEVILELRSLNSLRCGFVSFSSSVLAGLLQLPQLELLELEEFRLIHNPSDQTPDWDMLDQRGTALRYLTINAIGPPATFSTTSALVHLLKQEKLVELTYRPHIFLQVQRGISVLWTISSHIPDYVFTSLRRLYIMLPPSDDEIQHFVQLGARCPNLTSLTITWNFLDTTSQLEDRLERSGLTEYHFPALQHFDGPFALAPIFVQKRPVHTVISDMFTQLQGTDRGESRMPLALNIAALKPTVPLRVLHLVVSRWSDGDFEAIAQHHPELEELDYECLGEEAMCWSTKLGDAFRALTKLKRLTLENMENEFPPDDVNEDNHLVAKLRSICPNLRYAYISWLGTWRLDPEHKYFFSTVADYTTILPHETWLAVLEFLAGPLPSSPTKAATFNDDPAILKSSPDIRTVSSLSRFFLQLADPFRFRVVHFTVHPSKSSTHKLRRMKELLDLLDRRPEVKSWIQVLSIGQQRREQAGTREDNFGEEYVAIETKIHRILPELRGLRVLRCGFMSFYPSLFDNILQLTNLDEPQLEGFQFIPGTANQTPSCNTISQDKSSLRSLKLKLLGPLSAPATQALIRLLQQETLAELDYWPPATLNPGTLVNSLWIISSHILDQVFTSLRELDIALRPSDAEVQHFVQFGARCPNIVSLTVRYSLSYSLIELEDLLWHRSLAERPFPALQEFEGPLPLAPILVQGRPVHSVFNRVLNKRSLTTITSNIATLKPSVPLHTLHLATPEWNEADIEAIAQHHPDLEELIYDYCGEEQMRWSTRLEDALVKLGKLKIFTLTHRTMSNDQTNDAGDDHHLIAKLRSACPNLQWTHNVSWVGTWVPRPKRKKSKNVETSTLAREPGRIRNCTKLAPEADLGDSRLSIPFCILDMTNFLARTIDGGSQSTDLGTVTFGVPGNANMSAGKREENSIGDSCNVSPTLWTTTDLQYFFPTMTDHTTILPPETWLKVIQFLAAEPRSIYDMILHPGSNITILISSPCIRKVSSLSRFFLQLTDSYRFREVDFRVYPLKSPIEKLRRIEELLDLLERRPEVKSWIRSLSIGQQRVAASEEFRGDNFDEEYVAIESKIRKVLPELRGLSVLWCGFMSFSPSLFSGVLQLPNLDKLELEDFRFIRGTADEAPSWNTIGQDRSSLRSLKLNSIGPLSAPATQALIRLLQQETLTKLIYQPPLVLNLRGSILWMISSHIPDYVFTSLRELSITLSYSDAGVKDFAQFGARCPSLVSLTVNWLLKNPPNALVDQLRRSSLAEHPFPALQKFRGSLDLASILVHGRPVHSVTNHFKHVRSGDERGPTMASNIAALRPSVPLRELHLEVPKWNESDIEAIAQHHPDLEELVYEFRGWEPVVWSTRLEDALGKLGKLKRLTLENSELEKLVGPNYSQTDDVGDDHHLIVKLRSLCPNLQGVHIYPVRQMEASSRTHALTYLNERYIWNY